MSEVEFDSDEEVSKDHSKLLQAVAQLDKKQRVNKAERSEPTLEVSEFHLIKSGITNKDAVHVRDLVKSLGQKGYQSQITREVRSIQQKSKPISKPLEKPSAEKIKMKSGFERTLKDLSRWNAIVARNRTSTHLSFPLRNPKKKLKIDPVAKYLDGFRLKSVLQQKLEALEPQEPLTTASDDEECQKKDETSKSQMTLEEMKLKRSEAARLRAQQSYKEAKAHRQRKIKSKKFHQIERKKRTKEQLKEFEELQKTNPEEALAKLQQLDKSRAEERMSLRHKSTGQWAKNKQIRAKYDRETRQVLAEQLSIGRELTQKIRPSEDSDEDEDEENEEPLILSNEDKNNPWMNDVKTEPEINEFIESYRKYWDEKKKKSEEKSAATVNDDSKSSTNELNNEKKKEVSKESNETGTAVTSTVTSKKVKAPTKDKKVKKKAMKSDLQEKLEEPKESPLNKKNGKDKSKKKSINCATTDEVKEKKKKKKVKLSDEKAEVKMKKKCNAKAASNKEVELECNKETNLKASKTPKVKDIDDMFDSVTENIVRKVDIKIKKMKKKLEAKNKMDKRRKENKKDVDDIGNLEFKETKQKPILDLPLEETTSKENSQQNSDLISLKTTENTEQESTNKTNIHAAEIDPQKYLKIKPKYLKTQMPDLDTGGEDAVDNSEQEEETHRIMSEAFADDDVVEEFRREKKEEVKNSQPQNIDLSLPGWGSWAGTNIKPSRRKKRKHKIFITKPLKQVTRKDENKGDVIIFEGQSDKLKGHLVNDLPYPFTTVKDFEASIRAPLGRTFVPENAHRRLIQPSIVTKPGQVIEPMTENVLVQKQPAVKRRIDKQKRNSTRGIKKQRR